MLRQRTCHSSRYKTGWPQRYICPDRSDLQLVNQFGGHSGTTPADFAGMVRQIAARSRFAEERILLGGDHLGPYPWQNLPVREAMVNAAAMIQAYAEAGFGKLHLDTSMPCLGDGQDGALEPDLIAERSAHLCRVADRLQVH